MTNGVQLVHMKIRSPQQLFGSMKADVPVWRTRPVGVCVPILNVPRLLERVMIAPPCQVARRSLSLSPLTSSQRRLQADW